MMRRVTVSGLGLIVLVVLGSCGGPVVRTVADDDWLHRPVTLDRNRHLPAQLSSHLAYLGLDDRYAADPWATLLVLDERWRAHARPVELPADAERQAVMRKGVSYVLAAAAYQYAVRQPPPVYDQQLRAMSTALTAAYTFLFEPTLPHLAEVPEALDERTNDAREIHNRAMAWLALHHHHRSPTEDQLVLPMVGGVLRLARGENQLPYPRERFVGFDTAYALHGLGQEPPVLQRGLGAPMVVRVQHREKSLSLACAATMAVRLTSFPTDQEVVTGEWLVLDPLRQLRYPLLPDRAPLRLEADLTTPLQVLAAELPKDYQRTGIFDGDRVAQIAGLNMLEPYQPGRIPLVLVHGTFSNPQAWLPLLASLRGDPWLRQRYQVWFFRYPTSNPIPASATLLRDSLASHVRRHDPDGRDPALRNVVVMGHSMGGLITRLLVTDSDENLKAVLAPDLPAGEQGSALLERCAVFSREPRITRVVYIGTPHRGVSLLDAFWLDGAARWLVLPPESADLAAFSGGESTSLHHMRPGSRFLTWLATRPAAGPGVRVHSVLGDLGEGDDGLVTRDSAHLAEAVSEVVLKADHGQIYRNSAALVELRRILDQHLRE